MPSPRSPGAPLGRPASGAWIVRELPLLLEPVTSDPFLDGSDAPRPVAARRRDRVAPRAITPQRALVRESLLRVEREERA